MSTGIRKFVVFAIAMIVSWIVGINVAPTWTVEQVALDARGDSDGRLSYMYRDKPAFFEAVPMEDARLNPERMKGSREAPEVTREFVSVV